MRQYSSGRYAGFAKAADGVGLYNGQKRGGVLRQWTSMPRVSMDFNLADSSVTEALGQALARSLPAVVHTSAAVGTLAEPTAAASGAAVLYLRGELGAGKTTCVRSLLRAFGVTGPVRSPTYALLETYSLGALTCVHVDLYRLQTLIEVDELGLRDLLAPGHLLLVEWPERGGAAVPPADLDLTLQYAANGRQARLRAASELGSTWLANLGRDRSLSFYVSNLT
jgi:tRNA threonylcarbamoyladenosine biosynthesis protein TsaE